MITEEFSDDLTMNVVPDVIVRDSSAARVDGSLQRPAFDSFAASTAADSPAGSSKGSNSTPTLRAPSGRRTDVDRRLFDDDDDVLPWMIDGSREDLKPFSGIGRVTEADREKGWNL